MRIYYYIGIMIDNSAFSLSLSLSRSRSRSLSHTLSLSPPNGKFPTRIHTAVQRVREGCGPRAKHYLDRPEQLLLSLAQKRRFSRATDGIAGLRAFCILPPSLLLFLPSPPRIVKKNGTDRSGWARWNIRRDISAERIQSIELTPSPLHSSFKPPSSGEP